MRLHSTHDQLVKLQEVLIAFFPRTQADEKGEIKLPLEPWSADPENIMRESINIRTAAKKTDVPGAGRGKPKQLCEQYNLRDTFYWMKKSLKTFSAFKLRQDIFNPIAVAQCQDLQSPFITKRKIRGPSYHLQGSQGWWIFFLGPPNMTWVEILEDGPSSLLSPRLQKAVGQQGLNHTLF